MQFSDALSARGLPIVKLAPNDSGVEATIAALPDRPDTVVFDRHVRGARSAAQPEETRLSFVCSRAASRLRSCGPTVQGSDACLRRFVMEELFAWRMRRTLPEALLVLDSQDVHFLRGHRQRQARSARARELPCSVRRWGIGAGR
jgi:hypothetical protein